MGKLGTSEGILNSVSRWLLDTVANHMGINSQPFLTPVKRLRLVLKQKLFISPCLLGNYVEFRYHIFS